MKKRRHYICLNEQEFTVLFAECGVNELVAYNSKLTQFTQEDYNEGIFSLYKRELLQSVPNGEGFSLNDEIKEVLNILKSCEFVFTIDGPQDFPEYCIYKDNNSFLITTPGTRKNEYIKMMVADGEELLDFLSEGELLPERIVLSDVVVCRKDAHTGVQLEMVAARSGTIFDELQHSNQEEITTVEYEKGAAVKMIFKMMGGSYGIS